MTTAEILNLIAPIIEILIAVLGLSFAIQNTTKTNSTK